MTPMLSGLRYWTLPQLRSEGSIENAQNRPHHRHLGNAENEGIAVSQIKDVAA